MGRGVETGFALLQQNKTQKTAHQYKAGYNGNNHHRIRLAKMARSRAVSGDVQRSNRILPCVRFLDTGVHTPKSSIGQTKNRGFKFSDPWRKLTASAVNS